jgi:hypothetical protein
MYENSIGWRSLKNVIDLHLPMFNSNALASHNSSQSIQIVPTLQAISETTHRMEQFHVVSIKKDPHVLKNPSDLIHKLNETEWPQMAAQVTKISLETQWTILKRWILPEK